MKDISLISEEISEMLKTFSDIYKSKGIKHHEIAEKLGKSIDAIDYLLNCRGKSPGFLDICQLAVIAGCSVDDFFSGNVLSGSKAANSLIVSVELLDNYELHELIAMELRRQGYRLQNFSEDAGIDLSTLKDIVGGRIKNPRFTTIYIVCQTLDITVESLNIYNRKHEKIKYYFDIYTKYYF